MRASVQRGCLSTERYDRWRVLIGDTALFTQATMHCGTRSNSSQERQALCCVLTPFEEKRQDDYQIFRCILCCVIMVQRDRLVHEKHRKPPPSLYSSTPSW